ncbi:MAG: putative lipid II flippase FtsW [Oscillospiraceae bacterium]|jgi:cell division protein FtsW|nr:putative lipid II flippase FtsW [Oscillospiraceae bacterium]
MDQEYPLPEVKEEKAQERIRRRRELFKGANAPMDLPFAALVVLLSCIGLIMMFSASYASASYEENDPAYFLVRQGPYMLLGLPLMYLISRVNYQYFRALSVPAMIIAVVLLMLVPFIGVKVNGARRWLIIFGISVQPSEIAKIAMILLFAAIISKNYKVMKTFRHGILPFAAILAMLLGLLYLQPHLSGMVLIAAVGAVLLFLGGVRLRYYLAAAGLIVPLAIFVVNTMEHAKQRIAVWRDPWIAPRGAGYQAIQSLLAIGSGGLFGLGLGQSRQKYLYLPEGHNDFVFAIVAEELGLFGAGIVLLLFAILIIRGYWIALHAPDRFGSLMVAGITTLLAIQVFLNVAVVSNLIPVTGISMPFFSYGGSALLIQLVEMGVVLSVSRQISAGKSV